MQFIPIPGHITNPNPKPIATMGLFRLVPLPTSKLSPAGAKTNANMVINRNKFIFFARK